MNQKNHSSDKGYKQTEVGVIPEDWEVMKLGEFVKITSGESPSRFKFTDDGTPYFKVEQLNNGNKYLIETPYHSKFKTTVPRGSIIFPKRGASILLNKIRILLEDSFMDTNLMTLTLPDELSNEFFYYALLHKELWRIADTTSIPQINNKHINPFQIPFPPAKSEQTAIATALSDADALIQSLEKLIAKKRNIKQGAMQKCLNYDSCDLHDDHDLKNQGNQKNHRNHSSDKWVVKKLGEIGTFSKGQGIRKDESMSGTIPCIRYGELYTRHNDYVKQYYSFISDSVAQTAKKLKQGDILFAGSGETKEEIGKCAAFLDNIEAYAGGDVVIFSPVNVDSLFLGFYLNTPVVIKQKASRGQGDAVVHISAGNLKDIEIPIPPLPDQTRIATILSDMDAEIAASETKLAKYKQIKQGMMQELLTGKTRLI